MKSRARRVLILALTFAVIIAIFWFVLPATGVAAVFGRSYFMVSLVGSLVISIIVSRALSRLIR